MSFYFLQQQVCDWFWKYCADCEDDNVKGVGFGMALKDGELDLSRPLVMRLYVKSKRPKKSRSKKRPKSEIDTHIEFCMDHIGTPLNQNPETSYRDFHDRPIDAARIRLPTDVHEVGELTGSGALTKIVGDPSVVTAGAIVRWRQRRSLNVTRWGIVTVAHGFDLPIGSTEPSDTRILNPNTGNEFFGNRLIQFKPPFRGYDTVLIGVSESKLLTEGLISSASMPAAPTLSYRAIGESGGVAGRAFQRGRLVDFSVVGNVAPLNFRGVGTVGRLVHVRANAPQAFVETTSGSVYSILHRRTRRLVPAAIQIGSDNRLPVPFRDGYGQCLRDILSNLAMEINRRLANVNDRLENGIQLVTYF